MELSLTRERELEAEEQAAEEEAEAYAATSQPPLSSFTTSATAPYHAGFREVPSYRDAGSLSRLGSARSPARRSGTLASTRSISVSPRRLSTPSIPARSVISYAVCPSG